MNLFSCCSIKKTSVQRLTKEEENKKQEISPFAFHDDVYRSGSLAFHECEFRAPAAAAIQLDEFHRLMPIVGIKSSINHKSSIIQVIFDRATHVILAISHDCSMIHKQPINILRKRFSSLFKDSAQFQKNFDEQSADLKSGHSSIQSVQLALSPGRFSADKSPFRSVDLFCFFGQALGVAVIGQNLTRPDQESVFKCFAQALKAEYSKIDTAVAAKVEKEASAQESPFQSNISGTSPSVQYSPDKSKLHTRFHLPPLDTGESIAGSTIILLPASAAHPSAARLAAQPAADPARVFKRAPRSHSRLYGPLLAPQDTPPSRPAPLHRLSPKEVGALKPPLPPADHAAAETAATQITEEFVRFVIPKELALVGASADSARSERGEKGRLTDNRSHPKIPAAAVQLLPSPATSQIRRPNPFLSAQNMRLNTTVGATAQSRLPAISEVSKKRSTI